MQLRGDVCGNPQIRSVASPVRKKGGAGAAFFSLVTGLKEMAEGVLVGFGLDVGKIFFTWSVVLHSELGTGKGITGASKMFTASSLPEFSKHLDNAPRLMV